MTQLINFLNNLNEDYVSVEYRNRYDSKTTSFRALKDVVLFEDGRLVRNYSLLSNRILVGNRLYTFKVEKP